MDTSDGRQFSELTADIVSAYVSNNSLHQNDLISLISNVHAALKGTQNGSAEPAVPEAREPIVAVRRSVTPDYIICLEDGKKFKSLKRHLASEHGISPNEYRAKWGLKQDYPMVAPNYSESRSALAKSLGLGRKAAPEVAAAPATREPVERAPAKRSRRGKAAA